MRILCNKLNDKLVKGGHINNTKGFTLYEENVDLYDKETNELIVSFIKEAIDEHYKNNVLENLSPSCVVNTNRGYAAGEVSPNKMQKYFPKRKYKKVSKLKICHIKDNGQVSNYRQSMPVECGLIGYFNKKSELGDWVAKTGYSDKHSDRVDACAGFIRSVGSMFSKFSSDMNDTAFTLYGTPFSTITVNKNFQTAIHKDQGNHGTYSAMVVVKEGFVEGGYLLFPEYKVGIKMDDLDMVIMNSTALHCNSPISGEGSRYSFIFYYRQIIHDIVSKIKKIETSKTIQIRDTRGTLPFFIRPDTTDAQVVDELVNRKCYEHLRFKFRICKDDVWLDLGANIGVFTCLVLMRGGRCIAYEPEPTNFTLLQMNTELYNKTHPDNKGYLLIKKGVHLFNGKSQLYLTKNNKRNKYRHTVIHKKSRVAIDIQVQKMERILKLHKDIDCIKMDIEGIEIELLENFTQWGSIKKLVFEYSFDVDKSIPRFLKIIDLLQVHFSRIHYTKVKKDELIYNYFPAQTIVFCLK